MKTECPIPILLVDYKQPAFLIDDVFLDIKLGETSTEVVAELQVHRNPTAGHPHVALVLNGEQLKTQWVAIDGHKLESEKYTVTKNELVISDPPEKFILKTSVIIKPQKNTQLEGIYKSNGIFCSQCEAEGFRRITWYLDRPDILARFRTQITGNKKKYPILLSNGNCTNTKTFRDGTHLALWEDPYPKPSYLFALVAGNLGCLQDEFITASGRNVALKIFVDLGKEVQARHAMKCLIKAMRWDEEVFGLEYDLDVYMIVAVSAFNMGAMENKGLNLFNDKYVLADPETATDMDYALIESIIAHEYFHNWTGNRVTCRDWFQLSLKEGLTVFRDQAFSADMSSAAVERIKAVKTLRARQFPEDASPLAHPIRPESYIEINNFYTATVYEKGAEVIRMMHTLLGANGFRKGMDLYFERHDGHAVTCNDFVSAMEDANNFDLSQFRIWYSQSGTPTLFVGDTFNEDKQSYTLTIHQLTEPTQGQTEKKPLHIPIRVALLNANGDRTPLSADGATEKILELKRRKQSFTFENIGSPPKLSLLRNFSAPVKIEWLSKENPSSEKLAFLMRNDDDPFNRWEASQILAKRLIFTTIDDGPPKEKNIKVYTDSLRELLEDEKTDPALVAEILGLPLETELADIQKPINIDGIHIARETIREQIAKRLEKQLFRVYQRHTTRETYRYTAIQVAQRRLRNVALYYIAALNRHDTVKIAKAQFDNSSNMTDCMGSLIALNNCCAPERDEALKIFHRKWRGNSLVIDKWFTLQATSFKHGTLTRIKELMQNDSYSIKSPNRVRALIGAFSNSNQVQFHAKNGAGYAFLTEQIIELNTINPQIAARLLMPLSRWRCLDKQRQLLVKKCLENILNTKEISRNVFEITSKMLGDDSTRL